MTLSKFNRIMSLLDELEIELNKIAASVGYMSYTEFHGAGSGG